MLLGNALDSKLFIISCVSIANCRHRDRPVHRLLQVQRSECQEQHSTAHCAPRELHVRIFAGFLSVVGHTVSSNWESMFLRRDVQIVQQLASWFWRSFQCPHGTVAALSNQPWCIECEVTCTARNESTGNAGVELAKRTAPTLSLWPVVVNCAMVVSTL